MRNRIEAITKSDIEAMDRKELYTLRNIFLQISDKWFGDPAWPDCTEEECLVKYNLLVSEMKKRDLMFITKGIDRSLFGMKAKEISKSEPVDISKPYPNYHSCELRDPGDFKDGTIRTSYRKHDGKQYSVLMGKLEGETSMTEVSYKYHKETWEVADAQSHCSDHDGNFVKAKEIEKQEISLMVKFVGIKKEATGEEDTEHFVMGVVYEPDTEDSQGDWANAADIRKAAHSFMETGQVQKLNHEGEQADLAVLESYLAPVDFEIGDDKVVKGSWLLGSRILDLDIWEGIKSGVHTGYSMAGDGLRIIA